MQDRPTYDRIRAFCEGSLPPDEVARLQAEIAADADLRRAVEEYGFAHRATDPTPVAVPSSRLSFEDVWRRVGSEEAERPRGGRNGWLLGLGAAALLLAGLLLLAPERAGRHGTELPAASGPVLLAAIPWEPAAAGAAPDLPSALAGYRPVAGRRIRWLDDRDTARRVAEAVGLPLLVYVASPDCPLCREMDRDALRDPDVLEVVARSIPLRLDVAALPPEAQRVAFSRGWPFFAVERRDGQEVAAFPGWHGGAEFRARLLRALEAAGAPSGPPSFAAVDAACARTALRSASAASRAAPTSPEAHAAARRDLELVAARLTGPVADDLARVLARWSADGRFPDLAEAKR